jgi:surface antigen
VAPARQADEVGVRSNRSPSRTARVAGRALALLGCALTIATAAPSAAGALTFLTWEPSALRFWDVNQSAITGIFQNGQCTEWAADKRPDVVQAIVTGFIANELAHGQIEAVPDFDALNWTRDAQLVGIPTGHKPRAGALIVFQPGVLGAGPAGHIAYVVRVRRRSFTISEMNAPVPYQVTYRTLRASTARAAGVSFIY